jgi:dipeptidyl aminopeptidase/acylaminoacyl peptidase
MTRQTARPLTAEDLWRIDRIAGLALAPDGARTVCSVTRYDTTLNQGSTALWVLSTRGAAPRQLTRCGSKDGQAAWSPRGERICT